MADLDVFRQQTRDWLEENCPASMRTPQVEDETVWGGRKEEFKNPDSKLWLERMAALGGGGIPKTEFAKDPRGGGL